MEKLVRALISIPLSSLAQLCPMSQLWRALENHRRFGTAINPHIYSPASTWVESGGHEQGLPASWVPLTCTGPKGTKPLLYWALLEKATGLERPPG